jgi:hypothetical protein
MQREYTDRWSVGTSPRLSTRGTTKEGIAYVVIQMPDGRVLKGYDHEHVRQYQAGELSRPVHQALPQPRGARLGREGRRKLGKPPVEAHPPAARGRARR